jgi:hypothetical protein
VKLLPVSARDAFNSSLWELGQVFGGKFPSGEVALSMANLSLGLYLPSRLRHIWEKHVDVKNRPPLYEVDGETFYISQKGKEALEAVKIYVHD